MKTKLRSLGFSAGLALLVPILFGPAPAATAQPFVHPGCLSQQSDFDRMAAKVAAGAHPWIDSWDILIANSHAQSNYVASPVATLVRGTGNSACSTENYSHAYNDAAAAYQLALRWKITGNVNYANTAVNILNGWSSTCTSICGDSNEYLAAGIYGYEFACAAEIMRTYSGWAAADFARFQSFMTNVFYPLNHDFLVRHNNACDTHYWANWDLCNMASIEAIGILCDDRTKYDEAITYFKTGIGNGNIDRAVYFVHPGYLGQGQEEGRDQGHSGLDVSLLGVICEMAWNQGDDLYGYENNKVLTLFEYFAKYNLTNSVPYFCYDTCDPVVQPVISTNSQGDIRPAWDILYNHWANLIGVAAPYTAQYAALVRPEGGGGNYGPNSGGYDQLGFTTLTHTRDPLSSVVAPSGLTATANGLQATLQWWGSAGATSYNVKCATTSGGPYTTIATGITGTTYTNTGLVDGITYYYVVSATSPSGETTNSAEAGATASNIAKLSGAIIGTAGSYNNLGNTITNVFDGSLINYFDAPTGSGAWAGLDLGTARVITQVQYCPRPTWGSRMVGGEFQGANVADFSSGVVTLFTVSTAPPDGVLTAQAITDTNTYRYVRYLSPANGWCNVADVAFWGQIASGPPPLPAAPTSLGATGGDAVVNLGWVQSSSPGITANKVYRSTSGSGGPYNLLASLAATTSYSDTAVVNGDTYFYSVSAVNANGESALSAYAGATPESPYPPAPTALAATAVSPNEIDLSWTDTAGTGNYDVYRATVSGGPYTRIATGVTATSYPDTGVVGGTTYYYVVTAVNSNGESPDSNEAGATTPVLPTGWSDQDVGTVALAGSASYNSGTYTVNGSGGDIGSSADGFNYAYESMTGDGTITVRLASATWAGSAGKIGIMMRETTGSGSRHASILLDHGLSNTLRMSYRTSTGGGTTWVNGPASITPPEWLRLQRSGNTLTTSYSSNGSTWTTLASKTVTMASTIDVGLAVCARSSTTLATGAFDNVTAP